jgi:hypothetical protein
MSGVAKFALAFVAAILNFVRSAYNFYTDAPMKDKVVCVSLSRKMRCVFLRCNKTEIHEQASFCKLYSLIYPSEQIMCCVPKWVKDSHVA